MAHEDVTFIIRPAEENPPVPPVVAMRKFRKRLEALLAASMIKGWSACIWTDKHQSAARVRFLDSRSAMTAKVSLQD
jgi:hypothetical protein